MNPPDPIRADTSGSAPPSSPFTESASYLQSVISVAPVILFVIRPDGTFILSEGKGLEAIGLKPGQDVGLNGFDIYKDYPAVLETARRAIAGETVRETVEVMNRVYDLQLTPTFENNQVVSVTGVAVDVTAHHQASRELTENRRMLLTLMSNLPGMVYRCNNDPDWTMQFVSEGAAELTGYRPDELVGNHRISYSQVIHPDDRQPVWQEIQSRVTIHSPFQITYRIITAAKQVKWVREQGRGIFSPDGRIEALEGFITDVTGRKVAEDRAQLLALAINQITEGIAVTDLRGRLLFVNQAFHFIHGYKPEELIGKHLSVLHPNTRMSVVDEAMERIKREGEFKGEIGQVRRDGRPVPVFLHAFMLRSEQGQPIGVIATLRDITEQKNAEAERARLEAQLYQIQKLEAIGQLAGGVAHDFNNLLAVIMGNASILKRDTSLQPKTRDALLDIMSAAERGSALTQQLLAYARGGLQEPTATDLNRLVRSIAPMLERTMPARIGFELHLADHLPSIVADPPRIEQIVMNLCLNAIQASSPPATVTLATNEETLDESAAAALDLKEGRYIRLEVTDHGCGIDPQIQARIFEPFFSTKEMGRGMGLSVTHGIVQSHRGQIRVQSTPGQGTTVSVWLPATDQPEVALRPGATVPRTQPLPRGTETILVIDDETALAATLEQMLSALGYCVVSHTDADQAIAFLGTNAEDVNLVLCDLTMPKRSGREIAEMIARQYPRIIVLLTSGYSAESLETELKGIPAAGFIQKPFSLAILARSVRDALDRPASSAPSSQ